MTYTRPSTKRMAPVPTEFVEEFIRGGHRRVERIYGCRSDCKVKWMERVGRRKLEQARREFFRGGVALEEAVRSVLPSAVNVEVS